MRFTQEFVERVLEANNIVDIISQYTQLRNSGGGFMGRCPFPDHPEKTPSFSVSESKQVYHCFGCKKQGNLIGFLRDYNGMAFVDSVEYLAERAHIPLPIADDAHSREEAAANAKKKQLLQIYDQAKNFYRAQFLQAGESSIVGAYVKKRGLSAETCETFQVGVAPHEWDALTQHLTQKGFSLPLAEEGRLIRMRDSKNGYYDLFRERLMFPIHNMKGEVIAFGGRILAQGEPKYLNSPEHPLFSKRKTLYGLHQTARYIRAEDAVILVEGYMDLVSLYQAGIRNLVATMGTALTAEQAYALKRLTPNAITLFDGDDAGVAAAEKALPILLAAGLRPKGIILPDNQDPDDYVKNNGGDALKTLIANSVDLFFLVLQQWLKNFRGDPAEKLAIVDRVGPWLSQIPDPRLRDLYERELQFRLAVDAKWMKQALLAPKGGATGPTASAFSEPQKNISADQKPPSENVISIKSAPPYYKLLVALSLQDQELFDQLADAAWLGEIRHEGIHELIARAARLYRQAPEKFDKLTGLLMTFVDQSEALIAPKVRSHLPAQSPDANADETADAVADDSTNETRQEDKKLWLDCVRKIRDDFLLARAKELQLELRSNPSPAVLEELRSIQQARRRLIKDPNFLRTKPDEGETEGTL